MLSRLVVSGHSPGVRHRRAAIALTWGLLLLALALFWLLTGPAEAARAARFPHAGDLILLGAYDGERVVSFEEEVATHGGLGGPQAWPFIAFPPAMRLPAQGIGNAEEVYTRLVGVYGGDSS
jgi:hypothetical protein